MEIENISILKSKIITILDATLINDFKKINTSCMPDRLFNASLLEDVVYYAPNYDAKKLQELLDLFDLNENIIYKNYNNISKSEYRKISIIISILRDKPIIFLKNPTVGLDIKSKKTLIKILKREKRDNKIIIVQSNDSEFLFQVVNLIIYKTSNKYVICDNKYSFFSNTRLLKTYDLQQPRIINFYVEAKKKKVKLINRDNINDLIKEIYRNAQ